MRVGSSWSSWPTRPATARPSEPSRSASTRKRTTSASCADRKGEILVKIGILGTGDVGRVLGAAFARLGHDVKIGSRDAQSDKVRAWVDKTGPRASSGTFAEAARFGDLVVVATAWS